MSLRRSSKSLEYPQSGRGFSVSELPSNFIYIIGFWFLLLSVDSTDKNTIRVKFVYDK